MQQPFSITLKVRDYECDIQGIVNNSVYQNYLEHARHEYLRSCGIDFAELAQRGVNLVMTRIEMDYKTPLRSGDSFTVDVTLSRSSKIRGEFQQKIYRQGDKKVCVEAKITWVTINKEGRVFLPPEIDQFLTEAAQRAASTTTE